MSESATAATAAASGRTEGKGSRVRERAKGLWPVIKAAVGDFIDDKVPKLSASLAFYTMLSIAPLLVIAIKIVGSIYGDEAAQGQVETYAREWVGAEGAKSIQDMVKNAGSSGAGVVATILSSILLLFSATGLFGELQDSMNTIWEVKPKPDRGIWGTIKDRLFSLTLVLGTAFLLLVSLIASTVLSAVSKKLFGDQGWLWTALSFLLAFVVVAGLFAVLFKYLPDVRIAWKTVIGGALITAVLFTVGKFLLGLYLGRKGAMDVYGAAGSLAALLLWAYYSGMIFYFGAELTQAYAKAHGFQLAPAENAVPLAAEERARLGMPARADIAAASDPDLPAPIYPSVPINRSLTIPPEVAAGNGPSSSGGGKLVPLLMGVVLGKLLLGGKKKGPPGIRFPKKPGHTLAAGRIFEPGFVSRRRSAVQQQGRLAAGKEDGEYVVRFRPPAVAKRVADRVGEGYRTAKAKVKEFLEV